MRGAGEANLEIEAKEIRDNLTDFDYIGNERIGNKSGGNITSSPTCVQNFKLQIFSQSLSQTLRNGKEGSNS